MGNVRINKGGKSMDGPFSLNGAHTPSVVMNIFRHVIYLNHVSFHNVRFGGHVMSSFLGVAPINGTQILNF
jgi:hypothetical protein